MSAGHGGDGELTLPGLKSVHKMVGNVGSKGGISIPFWSIVIVFVLALVFFAANAPTQHALNWRMTLMTGPLWMPIVFGRFALMRYLQMRRLGFNLMNRFVLLELRLPRETKKTPRAMETVFTNIHLSPGEGTWMKKYWYGRTRPWWSFEIASFGGDIHYYVYVRESMRRAVEAAFYSQYPEIELIEAVDYSRLRDPSKEPFEIYATEYKHDKPDPFPIRTYVDYGLDKPGLKPEETTDPLANMLEIFGSIGPGEELWTQIIFRTTKTEKWRGKKPGRSWKDDAKDAIEEVKKKYQKEIIVVDPQSGALKQSSYSDMTDVGKEIVKAIERNIDKPPFDVGIRSIYSAPKDKFQVMAPFVSQLFKPYNSEHLNKIGPTGWSEIFSDYPWEDVGGKIKKAMMTEVVELYRMRSYFHPPYRGEWMIMSTEELASIFHIPSTAVRTPSLQRTPSTTSSAPANLPT